MTHTRKNQSMPELTVVGKPVMAEPVQKLHPPRPSQPQRAAQDAKPASRTASINWLVVSGGGLVIGFVFACLALFGGMTLFYTSDTMLPGTRVLGAKIGGLSEAQAAEQINATASTGIVVTDGQQEWRVEAASLGIQIDAAASASAAYQAGREQFLQALLSHVDVAPVLNLDMEQLRQHLSTLAPQFETPAINAGVAVVNGEVVARPAQTGYTLDLENTLAAVQQNAASLLADGKLELVMIPLEPTITDASGLLVQARQLLSTPLQITAFDPVRNESLEWSVAPQIWSTWLVATGSPTSGPLALTLATEPVNSYLQTQSGTLGETRYLNLDEATAALQATVAEGRTAATLRIFHTTTTHQVVGGDTFWSLARAYGIPYGWLTAANPGVGDSLSIGQTITIPSPDELLPLPIVYNKRIVINIAQQRMWAYENGTVKWEWVVSTGIADSPTAPGVFQVQSHFDNAYAGNWDLWMPYFIGIYQPVPNIDFMNGFHGFPTRGGSQLLWTNSLGTRVTYGCILLSDENAQLLYNWAEEGVVVEIQP